MMLSLPNTGTDWLVKCLLKTNKYNYSREFFNPMVNEKYCDILSKCFGCEYASLAHLIAKEPILSLATSVLNDSWNKETFDFTKETFSAFKIDFFFKKFTCFVLFRKIEQSMPSNVFERIYPLRSWYDAMFFSLIANKASLEPDIRKMVEVTEKYGLIERQIAAFVIYYSKLLKEAKDRQLIVLEYDKLLSFSAVKLVDYLTIPFICNPTLTASEVLETRKPRMDNFCSLGKKAVKFKELITSFAPEEYKALC